jgi:hypothetical protein
MSQKSNFLKNTLDLLETDPEVKSYIYQQIVEFNQFVTPETLVMVIARDPALSYSAEIAASYNEDENEDRHDYDLEEEAAIAKNHSYRIAIVLKDGEASIEAEAFNDDVFEAIRQAKEKLLARLIEIQEEMENPQDRIKAIKEASNNTQVH